MARTRFLNDQEKIDFYADLEGVDLTEYPYQNIMKVYKGAEFLIYHMTPEDLVVDAFIVCQGFKVTDDGVLISFGRSNPLEVLTLNDRPRKVLGLDILAHTPPRCLIERTIRVNSEGKQEEGMTATAIFRSKSDPDRYKPGYQQVISLTKAKHKFDAKLFEQWRQI